MMKTENYNLNQWEPTDHIRREDFNADNTAIDAALGALSTAAAGFGNCHIAAGSYNGTGTYGSSSPTRLSFGFKPQLVLMGYENKDGEVRCRLFVRNLNSRFDLSESFSSAELTMTWGDTSYSMYSTSATGQMN